MPSLISLLRYRVRSFQLALKHIITPARRSPTSQYPPPPTFLVLVLLTKRSKLAVIFAAFEKRLHPHLLTKYIQPQTPELPRFLLYPANSLLLPET